MTKNSSIYICQQCGFQASQFLGKCPECGSWNSLVETVDQAPQSRLKTQNEKRFNKEVNIINLADIKKDNYQRLSTGLGEFDRVLGGGIVLGSVVLVSGDPGVGKSTLLTQLALNINLGKDQSIKASNGQESAAELPRDVLYVAGEESAQQIKLRADRIKSGASLKILNETDVDIICTVIERQKPHLVIADSIQTFQTSDLTGVAGSVGQVRETAQRLQRVAKTFHIPIFIVGHVTKEGTIAGPKTLEHLVDGVLSLEGEATSNFRVLRATKNRFGPTDEIGIFEMEETGMREVVNPSALFLQQKVDAPGSVVAVTLNGYRPILIEIQALVSKSILPLPKRSGSGLDNNRLQLLIAVLAKRLNLPLYDKDVFVNLTGGLRVFEPAIDLGVCMSIISSLKEIKVKPQTVFIGEVGLLGELRNVRQMGKRISEAKKLGYKNIITPDDVKSLEDAVRLGLEKTH